ncbi:hypothetical protein AQUCO_03900120v1 [Aquilegia coerulea]|uniref:Glycosyltransferase n=1 Tax=Aquilegia coerulea TaxID=218851 RepID=A0A2G5CRV8_AQUCA|nr:hypothetical protein AQUCO_03900120v1 [Aquilegia coerulea]
METSSATKKPHAVCFPLPFQSHINSMLKFAKLLHLKGFHITFVNTEFNHQKVLQSRGQDSLKDLPADFRYETITDGLPPSDVNEMQNIGLLLDSITKNCLNPFRDLLAKINRASASSGDPPVSCIVSDGLLSLTLEAANELGVPEVLLWGGMAVSMWLIHHNQVFVEKGLLPLKDKSCLTNGYLDTPVEFIPGVTNFRLKDLPTVFYDGNDGFHNILCQQVERVPNASAIVVNTMEALEGSILKAMNSVLPPVYAIGPLQLLEQELPNHQLKSLGSNLWKEDEACLKWLDMKKPNSVVYVNFGTTTVLTPQQLLEFAWGLANSGYPFLWVIRPDLVIGEGAMLPPEFTKETAERGMITSWCRQVEVLRHPSLAGFLSHSGWNSIIETICGGVPIISWPFIGDHTNNCRYACAHWGISMEINSNVKRDEVEGLLRELIDGEKGKAMKKKTMEWKKIAEETTKPGGSSYSNIDKLIKEVMLVQKK